MVIQQFFLKLKKKISPSERGKRDREIYLIYWPILQISATSRDYIWISHVKNRKRDETSHHHNLLVNTLAKTKFKSERFIVETWHSNMYTSISEDLLNFTADAFHSIVIRFFFIATVNSFGSSLEHKVGIMAVSLMYFKLVPEAERRGQCSWGTKVWMVGNME